MMHHQAHQRHLRFQDENSVFSSSNSNLKQSSSSSSNVLKPQAGGSINGGVAKTPKQQKNKTRRAFGDISNKKRSNHHDGNAAPKLQIATQNGKSASKSANKKAAATSSKPFAKKAAPKSSHKQVSFVLNENISSTSTTNPTIGSSLNSNAKGSLQQEQLQDPFDLTGLDPIEQPAGRTWSEQERWSNDYDSVTDIPRLDMEQVFANRRRARDLEQERIEQEGWQLLQEEIDAMNRQDELDSIKMSEELYSKLDSMENDESFDNDLLDNLRIDDDEDVTAGFLDISF